MNIHPKARTTPAIRAEIQSSNLSQRKLAEKYNVTRPTIRKWQGRDSTGDYSHRPHKLNTTLSEAQEKVVVEIRKMLLLPLDDLLVVTREFINDQASRAGLARCLSRFGVSNLNRMKRERAEKEGTLETGKKKTFKDYEPGFIHIDIKYLPKMQDESSRGYLFVAIDRATRWVYLEIFKSKTAKNAQKFLKNLLAKAPFKIRKILTDNGKEFTDRFTPNGEREPTGNHKFDKTCAKNHIEHRLIKPKHPQTNGMVERFNGRVSDILKTTHFDSSQDLAATLKRYLRLYNHHIPQKALGHTTPVQALKEWEKKKQELFTKKAYKHARPNN